MNWSATEPWLDFDIDKSIVVDDFETNVFGTVDFVDTSKTGIYYVYYTITNSRGITGTTVLSVNVNKKNSNPFKHQRNSI